jgi:hypothetical protein
MENINFDTKYLTLPHTFVVWEDSMKVIFGVIIIYYSYFTDNSSHFDLLFRLLSFGCMITFPLLFFFHELGVYKYIINEDNLTIRFLYGKKKVIDKDKIARITKSDNRRKKGIEIHYKKSRKHATRIIKIPVTNPAYSSDELVNELSRLYLNR